MTRVKTAIKLFFKVFVGLIVFVASVLFTATSLFAQPAAPSQATSSETATTPTLPLPASSPAPSPIPAPGSAPAKKAILFPSLPTSVKATYKIYKAGILLGTVEEKFERVGDKGDRYKITSDTRSDGALSLFLKDQLTYASEGRITANGLVPTLFSSVRKSDASRNFTARFDWDKNEIVREHLSDGKKETETFPLPAGTQDRVSSMYQFMQSVPRSQTITAWMSQGKHSEQYVYVKQDEPTLTTRAGEFETVHYARDAKPGESKAQLWLAKSKNYLPVRMIFEDSRGMSLEQSLVELVVQ